MKKTKRPRLTPEKKRVYLGQNGNGRDSFKKHGHIATCTIMVVMNKLFMGLFRLVQLQLLMATFFCLFLTLKAINPKIDDDHVRQYPFCGSMNNQLPSSGNTGRVVNSEPARDNFRWTVYIIRNNLQLDGNVHESKCTGSVITDT